MIRALIPVLLSTTVLAQGVHYSAVLEGAQEVPPVAGNGRGWGIVDHDPTSNSVRIFVHHESLSGAPIAAHLQQGVVGGNGGIVLPLVAAGPGVFTGTATLAATQVAALATAGMYLNVRTAANPQGEIRGQIVVPVTSRFVARPSAQEVVPPTASVAWGAGVVAFLHEPENRVAYTVATGTLVGTTAVRFHQAPVGANGPVIATLPGTGSYFAGVTDRLTAAQVAAWKANGVYVNFTTTAFPGGEIRGQMWQETDADFLAVLSGGEEVPPNASPGIGAVTVTVIHDGMQIVVDGQFAGLSAAATRVALHLGAVGTNGPAVFQFQQATGLGLFSVSPMDVANLRAGNWYVNVFTAAFPGGEIRGQLRPARAPTTFGEGCAGSNGVRPQSSSRGLPVVGTSIYLRLHGGLPGGLALLALGVSRDQFLGQPLPIALSALGVAAPGCFLLVSPLASIALVNDGHGFGSLRFDVPLAPGLRGANLYSQWFGFDALANPSGFVPSNALKLTIQ